MGKAAERRKEIMRNRPTNKNKMCNITKEKCEVMCECHRERVLQQ